MFALTVDSDTLARLADDPAVVRIHEDVLDRVDLNVGSPHSLERIQMPAAYSVGATGNLRRVAILAHGWPPHPPAVPEFTAHFGRMLWDEQCGTGIFQLLSGRARLRRRCWIRPTTVTPPPSAGAGMARTSPAPQPGSTRA